jgi:FtsH-binding integral membrane protein
VTWVDTYVSWCFFIAMAAPVVFVIVYAYTPEGSQPWHSTVEGKVIMLGQVVWCFFLLNGVLFFALGEDYYGRNLFRVLLFTGLVVKLWSLTVLLIARRLETRRLQPQEPLPASQSSQHQGRRQPDLL